MADFGETGYADPVRPALGFGPEKVVAEATMLAYVVDAASVSTCVRDRVDALARTLVPLVRSPRALVDLTLNPDQAFRRAVPHVLLTALGHRDDAFDDVAADRCARVLPHAVDQPATVVAERAWLRGLWRRSLPPVRDPRPGTVLTDPFDLLAGGREDAYGLTHLLFYVTDFGRAATPEAGRPHRAILADVEALVIRYLDQGDYDLVAELLMAWPLLREPWSPAAAFAFRVLAHVEDQVGILPCGNVDPQRLAALEGAERTRYARAASYHTALVMGFLCAAALRDGGAPPTSPAAATTGPGQDDGGWQTLPGHGRRARGRLAGRVRPLRGRREACADPGAVRAGAHRRARPTRLRGGPRRPRRGPRLALPPHPLHAAASDLLGALCAAMDLSRRDGDAEA